MTTTNKPSRLTLRSIAPNIVTVLAMCAGLTSIKFALSGKFELAVAAIILGGVLDGIDGSIARMLKSTSKFGAELDSLSDAISFGVAPAVVLYMWSLQDLKGVGWVVTLIYAVSCVLRLARFNT
ncbi:MAG: phosphatidylcholine/phosphatidylserine synthase, partial [Sphingomonadales bacterium]|nr:phosphatidylcholine/phosphatidylserine synthase [Sphingomonadales bacterium]